MDSSVDALPGYRSLPVAHPLVQQALVRSSETIRSDARWLSDCGHNIWVAWMDPIPENAHGAGPRPGRVVVTTHEQIKAVEENAPLRVGASTGFGFLTARTHQMHTTVTGEPEAAPMVLNLPVLRVGRCDLPNHTQTCHRTEQGLACDDCGTGDYWLLPQYLIPAWAPGLSDPNDKTRLRGDISLLLALGSKPLKVIFTDHARYAMGATGRPLAPTVHRLMRVVHREDRGDLCVVKNKSGGEYMAKPDQIMLKEDHSRFSSTAG